MQRSGKGRQFWKAVLGAAIIFLLLNPGAVQAADKFWVGPNGGNWYDDNNWIGLGQPVAGDSVGVSQYDNTGILDLTVNYNPSVTGLFTRLDIGAVGIGTMTLNLNQPYALESINEYISARGTLMQSAGTNTVTDTLHMGWQAGIAGYNLSDTGSLTAKNLVVGSGGQATFTQTGGTNTVTGDLIMGGYSASPGSGTYNLSGGGILNATNLVVGQSNSSTFTQSGGTNTVTDRLTLGVDGQYGNGNGTYILSDGVLKTKDLWVGFSNTGSTSGTFTQTGGTNTVTNNLSVGANTFAIGTYDLSGNGVLWAKNLCVGDNGVGAFTQSAGINTVTDSLILGYKSLIFGSGYGTYNLSGTGSLSAGALYVGFTGTGDFTQSAGNLLTNSLTVGVTGTSISSFTQTGGTNTVTGRPDHGPPPRQLRRL